MAAVIGRGIEKLSGGSTPSDEVYDPNRNNRRGFNSPFAFYYTVTISMNTVAILGGIASEFSLHRNNYYYFNWCDAWLFTNACFGVAHIGAAAYIVHKIREPERQGPPMRSEGVFVTGYRLQGDPRDTKNNGDVEAAQAQPVVAQDSGPPDSLKRIRHVLCESKVFAGYIFVYLAYWMWHAFLDMHACNLGMALAMRCADVFLWAAPASFLFSVGTLMHRRGSL
mmetsp:Transcript_4096/g.9768  ORF Transcript_4096/g.9768 Transcript_4096/m.9768 type:complete len:224 (-) Transcript_4096:3-674(-)